MKILVTGGAGFIGSNLIPELLKDNNKVVCLDNLNDYYDPEIKKRNLSSFINNSNFTFINSDIEHRHKLNEIFNKYHFDAVVHLAARAGVRASLENPLLFNDANIIGTTNLLEFSRKFGVKQFIFASSSSVYGQRDSVPFVETDNCNFPISPYGASKRASEIFCYTYSQNFGLNVTILRFFNVYGPNNRPDMAHYLFAHALHHDLPIRKHGSGETKRDFTYVTDIVQGIKKSLAKPFQFEIFNLGNSHPITLNEMIEHFEKHFGKSAIIDQHPHQVGDADQTFADISKAKQLLGWEPVTPYHEGVELMIKWFKQNNS